MFIWEVKKIPKNKRKIFFCLGAVFLLCLTVFTNFSIAETTSFYPVQNHEQWIKKNPGELPIWPTPEEIPLMDNLGEDFTPTLPPTTPVRQPAEFEPMQGVLIRYPFGISYQIIAEMSEDTEVVTIVASQSQKNTVLSQYQSHGVNTDNCDFLIAPSDTYWTRDYGPWFIINGDNLQGITDFIYNRPRPNDDEIPVEYGDKYNIPVYGMDLIHSGGNYMCDGLGVAVSTDLVWSENPGKTHSEIEQFVQDYLGIHTYHVIPDALGLYIKHIDCFAKFLSPDTIMVTEVPQSHSQYDEIENTVDYFENQMSSWGKPYNVVRVYSPNGEPYTNSLILNDKVLVPITGSSWDDDAINSYQEAMPGYEVIGFTGSWATNDALHCRTMGITDKNMLYINHIPLQDSIPSEDGYLIEAEIIAYSGENLLTDQPMLYWKTDEQWNTLQMQPQGENIYSAYIPIQTYGTQISYYIHVEDYSGRSENHPYMGEYDPHTFTALLDNPSLDADSFTITARNGGTVNLNLDAGNSNQFRNYLILGSTSGTEPGFALPGGQKTLPLNWDWFTDFVLAQLNTPIFSNFLGTLNDKGEAIAQINAPPLGQQFKNQKLYFAFTCNNPWNYVSNPVVITII